MNDTLRSFDAGQGKTGFYYSLPALEEKGLGKISRLPVSIRIVLESVLRNCDGKKVAEKDVETLAAWNAKAPAHGRDSVCRRPHRVAGLHRRAAPGRSGGHAHRGRQIEEGSQDRRAAGAGGSGGRSLGAGGFLRFGRCVAPATSK